MVNKISENKRKQIINKSVDPLPTNPGRAGFKADDVKKAMFSFVTDEENSILAEINRLVDEINYALNNIDLSNYNTKDEITNLIKDFITKNAEDLVNYYTKTEINTIADTKISRVTDTAPRYRFYGVGYGSTADKIFEGYPGTTNKQWLAMYNTGGTLTVKTPTDANHATNKEYVDNLVSTIPKFSVEVVESLPTENISTTTVYLVASGSGEQNLYVEYIYVNNTWEKLGEQKIDLSNYPTIEEMNTAIAGYLANYYTTKQIDDLLSTLRSETPSKTSDLTNDGNGISPFATVAHLALRKIVYTGISGSEYSMNNTAVVNLDSFTYSTFDSIPNGTMIEVTFQNPYVNAIDDFPLFLNVNGTGAYRVLVTDGESDGYYNAVTMGGWKANDVLTFVKGRSWMLIAISGKLVIGNTDLNAIKSQYLKNAIITNNTLRITKQDGSTIDFVGGAGGTKIIWEVWE